MSFPASSENVMRYDQPQADGILSEHEQKYMSQWFDTLETEPTPSMMDIAPNGSASGLTYPETSSQNVMQFAGGFSPGFGGFDQTFNGTPGGYMYAIGHNGVGVPTAEGFAQQSNFQTISPIHPSAFAPYQMGHSPLTGLQNPSMQLVPKGKLPENRSVVYVKSEPTVPSRRPRSPSPTPSAGSSRQTPKRTPSRRKSLKESPSSSSPSGNRTQSPTGKDDAGQPAATSNAEAPPSSAAGGSGGAASSSTSSLSSSSATAANAATSSSSPVESDSASRAADSSELSSSSQQQQDSQQQQSSRPANRGGRGKKGHELLTEAEKKANHIASEQKRRQNIRQGFDQLVDIVPTLSQCHRSEALILQKSVEYIQQLLMQKGELKDRVKSLQATLGDVPDHLDDSDSEGDLDIMF